MVRVQRDYTATVASVNRLVNNYLLANKFTVCVRKSLVISWNFPAVRGNVSEEIIILAMASLDQLPVGTPRRNEHVVMNFHVASRYDVFVCLTLAIFFFV